MIIYFEILLRKDKIRNDFGTVIFQIFYNEISKSRIVELLPSLLPCVSMMCVCAYVEAGEGVYTCSCVHMCTHIYVCTCISLCACID